MLTHDPKFDVPLLEVALRLPEVAYIGAMGSRRTHDDRLARLREAGVTDEELARLSSPIGLDLGARTPEETAVSIAAEIIAGRWGGSRRAARHARRPHPPRAHHESHHDVPRGPARLRVAPTGATRGSAASHRRDADLQRPAAQACAPGRRSSSRVTPPPRSCGPRSSPAGPAPRPPSTPA